VEQPEAGPSGQAHHVTSSKITSYVTRRKINSTEKKKINESFLKLFYQDLQPFSITEDKGFREFVHNLNPNFEIPSRKTVSKSLIPAKYETCFSNVMKALQNVKSICLTTDAWTSLNNESFIAVTGHFIDEDFGCKKVLLRCCASTERHTSENLANDLKEVISYYSLDNKVNLVVTDNAANIVGAVKDKLNLKHLGCFGHTINLIVKDALAYDEVNKLICKVRAIVSHFKRSTVSLNKLNEAQLNIIRKKQKEKENEPVPVALEGELKKLLQDVVTRWNSTFYMLERFIELEEAIRSVLGQLDNPLEHPTGYEWLVLKDLKYVLSPFEKATKYTSADRHMSVSMVIPTTNDLVDICSAYMKGKDRPLSKPASDVLTLLERGLHTRLGNVENSNTLCLSTFLDPRFKEQAFKSTTAADSTKEVVVRIVAAEIQKKTREKEQPEPKPTDTKNNGASDEIELFSFFKRKVAQEAVSKKFSPRAKAIVEVDRFLEQEHLPISGDPSSWWKEHHLNFPHLSQLMVLRCCGVATSVPCERLFSKASNIVSERRSRLKNKKVSRLKDSCVNTSIKSG